MQTEFRFVALDIAFLKEMSTTAFLETGQVFEEEAKRLMAARKDAEQNEESSKAFKSENELYNSAIFTNAMRLLNQKNGCKSATKTPTEGNGETEEVEGEEEVVVESGIEDTLPWKCPITQQPFESPVTMRYMEGLGRSVCCHSFESSAIREIGRSNRNAPNRDGQWILCPVAGCRKSIRLDLLSRDAQIMQRDRKRKFEQLQKEVEKVLREQRDEREIAVDD